MEKRPTQYATKMNPLTRRLNSENEWTDQCLHDRGHQFYGCRTTGNNNEKLTTEKIKHPLEPKKSNRYKNKKIKDFKMLLINDVNRITDLEKLYGTLCQRVPHLLLSSTCVASSCFSLQRMLHLLALVNVLSSSFNQLALNLLISVFVCHFFSCNRCALHCLF